MDEKEAEIYSIKWWFEKEYTVHEQKYRRLISLNKPDDDGVDANEKLFTLYSQAEEKRKRIQQLEEGQ